MRINCFEPLIDSKSEILILGTLPGKESLKRKEYFADPITTSGILFIQLLNSQLVLIILKNAIFC